MYTRKLIDFFFAKPQQNKPLTNRGTSPEPEFEWPPSAADLERFSVVQLRGDDGPERAPVSDIA